MPQLPKRQITLEVRDYECDLQGIVNHAVYLNYMEHARHEYLKDIGLSFADLTLDNKFLVISKAEVSYKRSLKSGDRFHVVSELSIPKNFKALFHQSIEHVVTGQVMVDAVMTIAYLDNGKLSSFLPLFEDVLKRTGG